MFISTCGIEKKKHYLSLLCLLYGAFYAYAFYLIVCVSYACCVYETKQLTVNGHGVFYDIACGAVNVAHNGSLFAHKKIEECLFACICLADNGHGYAVFYGVALLERANQAVDDVLYLVGNGHELCTVGKLEVFMVGEVEFQFQ